MSESYENNFWKLMHPKVVELAKPRFDMGEDHYAESIIYCIREFNGILRADVKSRIGEDIGDGTKLIQKAFGGATPIYQLADISDKIEKDIQIGYMRIFEGTWIGIRNPKSHLNMKVDKQTTIHLLFITSFMFLKLEQLGLLEVKEEKVVTKSVIERIKEQQEQIRKENEIKGYLSSSVASHDAHNELIWLDKALKERLDKFKNESNLPLAGLSYGNGQFMCYQLPSIADGYGLHITWNNGNVYSVQNSKLTFELFKGVLFFEGFELVANESSLDRGWSFKFSKNEEGEPGWRVMNNSAQFFSKEQLANWIVEEFAEGVSRILQ